MNQFVEECRREWKRLRVPDPIAEEMAADLAADLEEGESEGASPEDVLGGGASDPRSFASAWAAERGVIPPARLMARPRPRSLVQAALAALTVIAAVGAALVLFVSPDDSASASPAHMVFAPTAERVLVLAPPPPAGVEANGSSVDLHTVGSILLIIGIVGVTVLLPFMFWLSRARTPLRG